MTDDIDWIVTIDAATENDLDNNDLMAMDEHAEEFDGSVGARGVAGPGITFRFDMKLFGPPHVAIEAAVDIAKKLASEVGIDDLDVVSATAETSAVFEERAMRSDTPELLASTDVAEILDVSRQRVHQLAERPDFPAPYARLGSGPIWTLPTIEAFARTWSRKPGRPSRQAS